MIQSFSFLLPDWIYNTIVLVGSSAVLWTFYRGVEPTVIAYDDHDHDYESRKKLKRRKSWILTLFVATVTSFASIPCVYSSGVLHGWSSESMYFRTLFTDTVVLFYTSYLLLDSLLMVREYPTERMMGWVHHVGYLVANIVAFIYGITDLFCYGFLVEIPTVYLSLGYIWPETQRRDNLTYILFFLFRVVFHGWMIYVLYKTRDASPIPILYLVIILPWLMHLEWFYKMTLAILGRRRRRSHRQPTH